jgi:hypothetical protein
LTVGASENYWLTGGAQTKPKDSQRGKVNYPVAPINESTYSDNPNGIAPFSSRGPTTDGRLKPEIVAPGTNIVSLRSKVKGAEELWGVYNSEYLYCGGTSMATPITAGAAAVVREILVKKVGLANPSAAILKNIMMLTATDLFPGQYGSGTPTQELKVRRPNVHEGYGRANVEAVLKLDNALVLDEVLGVATGEVREMISIAGPNGKLYAQLTWTDAAGTPAAAKSLVNDLDLEVVSESGSVVQLNDHINNAELIELSGLVPGSSYKVRVKGYSVPKGNAQAKQPFALVTWSI